MSSQVQDTFDLMKEANQAAHEALHKREAQGLERDGPLEQAAARDVEGIAREFLAEEKKHENKNPEAPGKEQENEMEDLITL